VPIAILGARIAMAVIRTVSLLLRPRLVNRLPWRYIYTLIRTRRATTIATASLALTIPLTLVGTANTDALRVSLVVGCIGLTTAWLTQRWQRR
jgi:hypothetical protein